MRDLSRVHISVGSPVIYDTMIEDDTSNDLDHFPDSAVLPNDGLLDCRSLFYFGRIADHTVGRYLSLAVYERSSVRLRRRSILVVGGRYRL
jgi:hypothetical protein